MLTPKIMSVKLVMYMLMAQTVSAQRIALVISMLLMHVLLIPATQMELKLMAHHVQQTIVVSILHSQMEQLVLGRNQNQNLLTIVDAQQTTNMPMVPTVSAQMLLVNSILVLTVWIPPASQMVPKPQMSPKCVALITAGLMPPSPINPLALLLIILSPNHQIHCSLL
jgi:hypothetical protein